MLTGAGGALCADGDVKGFAGAAKQDTAADTNLEQRVQGLGLSMEISRWLHEMPKPTLSIIGGPTAGGGLSFALACDLRMAIETAKFTTQYANTLACQQARWLTCKHATKEERIPLRSPAK